MQTVLPLCTPALEALLPDASQGLGLKGQALADFLAKQLTAHTRRLGPALRRANQQTWAALEIALAGPAWCEPLEKAASRPEDQAVAAAVRVFLNAHPLPEFAGKTRFRQQCLTELQAARQAGRLTLIEPSAQELSALAASFTADDAAARARQQLADAVKAAGYGNLAWFVAVQPQGGAPLPAKAMRYFFRRVVRADKELLAAPAFARLNQPDPAADPGLEALGEVWTRYGKRLGELLGDAPPTAQGLSLTLPPEKEKSQPRPVPHPASRPAPPARPPVVLEAEPVVLDAEPVVLDAEEILDAIPVGSPRPRREAPPGRPVYFAPVRFQVQVEDDPRGDLHGTFPAKVQSSGLALQPPDEREILVPVRSRAEALGESRFAVDVNGRQVRFRVRKSGANTRQLAEDVVRFLKGERRSLRASDYGRPAWLLPTAIGCGVLLFFGFAAAAGVIYALTRGDSTTAQYVAPPSPAPAVTVAAPPPPVVPPGNNPPIGPPDNNNPPFVPPPPPPPPPDNRPPPMPPQMKLIASNLGQFLSCAADPRDKAAFVCYKDGAVRYYSYPDFAAQEIYHIKGQAYQAAVDPNKGLLYAMVAKPDTLNPHPYAKHRVQAVGDLHIYDIKTLLQNKANAGDLQPVRVIPLAARVPNLYVSDNGRYVFFLDATDRRNARLRRVDTIGGDRIDDLKLADAMEILRVCPDDPTRMVAASSNGSVEEDWSKPNQFLDRLQVIDAANLAVVKTISIKDRFYDMALAPGGRAFLSPIKDWGPVSVVSLETGDVVAHWDGFQSEDFVVVSRNGKRLYREKQFGSPIGVDCWALPDDPADPPRQGLQPREGTEQDASRGEMILSPDGKCLLFKSGTVFELLNAVD